MENHYLIARRLSRVLSLVLLFLLVTARAGFSQTRSSVEEGVLRIKVSEELAAQLEGVRITRNADNVPLTGITSLDNVNRRFKASGIKRVFRKVGEFEAKHRRYGLHLWYEIQLDKAAPILEALAAYKTIPRVQLSEPIYKKEVIGSNSKIFGPVVYNKNDLATLPGPSNDPLLGGQWHYNNTGQTGGTPGADVSLFEAWGIETGNSNVIVAVTDGGIQVNHPDLAANMWVNTDEIPGNNVDDDNNGYVDDINGYGFGDDTGAIAPDNHGTHVGGTVAAVTNNGVGVAGVAGGSGSGDGVRLMSCAAFGAVNDGNFEGTYVYAADNGAVISQSSWGYTNAGAFEQVVLDAIDYFIAEAGRDSNGNQVGLMNGGIAIFAAGNSNSNAPHYPGFYASTLAVSATNHNDIKAWYSNYGPWVDVAAPGGETNSVAQQGVLSTLANNQYGFFQGTSMACPHVSGLAGLIVSKFGGPGLTPAMVRTRILETVDDIDALNPTFAGLLGSGRINAFSALQENDNTPPEAIADLTANAVGITEVTLQWTSPADAGNGSASSYDVRYSTSPINEGNFSSATPAPNPPSPGPAGSTETLTITGLAPGTTYYFAVKSADFFGNTSAISNVVEQATNFAPAIAVSPSSLNVTLQTAQQTSETLAIINTGQGPLTFTFLGIPSFATPSPLGGTVAAGDSLIVTVTIDAGGLLAGTYTESLYIGSNDPVMDTLSVPVTLTVINNGAPIASVEPDSLNFGGVFVGGSVSRTVQLHNAGSETLFITDVSSSNPDFTTNFADTISIPHFGEATLTVTYTASSVAPSSGTLAITTNDPANPTLLVSLTGEGLDAPGIVVTPDSLYQELHTGDTAMQILTVQNTGASDLEFAVNVSAGMQAVATEKQIDIPVKASAPASVAQKRMVPQAARTAQKISLRSVAKSAVSTSVLILTPDDDVSEIAAILNGFEDITATIFPTASLPAITVSDLTPYDIVFTTNNTQWLQAGGVSPVTIGDVLADYIDQGGKVIANQFAYSYDAWKMDGRFITEQYGPFTSSTTDAVVDVSLGTILAPEHPVAAGVSALTYEGYVQNVGLASGATAIAEWSNGELFLAANNNVVALNMLPSLGNGDPLQWTGDLPTIYQNAIHYLSGPGFISVSPQEGTIAPGDQLQLSVLFNASGLENGLHHASVDISSNVPGNELISVPATLNVLGPEFTVTPDSIYEALEKGETSTRTLVLSNNGSSDQPFNISVENKGISSVSLKSLTTSNVNRSSAGRISTSKKKDQSSGRVAVNLMGTQSLSSGREAGRLSTQEVPLSVEQYATDFESFALGDINGQQGWAGQYGNWTIETTDSTGGNQFFRGLSDGAGFTLAFSPEVSIGAEDKSTLTTKIKVEGTGVTWQIIPQSPSAGFLNTRIQFSPDGSVQALVSDGAGGGSFAAIPASVPSGYFDLTLEFDRATAEFNVYFNEDKVFTGQGFAGDIEQLVVLSLMEVAGPTLDLDDLQIIDGTKEFIPPYLTVSPVSGNLAAGESVEITLTFDASELDFGTYQSDVKIEIADVKELVVPTVLRVFGDPAVEVSPTVLQATVGFKEDTVHTFDIKNTGGNPLEYSLRIIGADTDVNNLPASPVSKFSDARANKRIADKLAEDNRLSKASAPEKNAAVSVLAGMALLNENFDGGSFPPAGWNVVDNAGTGVIWKFAAAWGEGNYSGTGEAATASSDAAGEFEFDTELISPSITTTGYKNIAVQFNANYQNYANRDFLNVDIQVGGSTTWTNVMSWNEDHGSHRGTPGEFVTLELDSYLGSATTFKLRWHYYNPNTGDFDWYAQIDDLVVLGDARVWLTASPAAGTIPVGGTQTVSAAFDAEDLEAGFYVAGILVTSNAVNAPLVGIVASLEVLEPAVISVEPDALTQELFVGETATQTLTITNSGESPLRFSFEGVATPGPSSEQKERRPLTNLGTKPATDEWKADERAAIISPVRKFAATTLYATSFEEFALGDINGQEGWAGQASNWTIENDNPFMGAQHFRGLSDGTGQSLAFSPEVAIGTDPVSSTTMRINRQGSGTSWQVIPQSPTAEFVNTRFEISADGSMRTLVDSLGGIYVPVPGTWPSGYTDLRLDFERATSRFTIYINNLPVFTGKGFAGDIEQVVLLSPMETAGPVFDIDNLAILDGTPQAPWLLVSPLSGTVPSGGSFPVTVIFNASDLEGGVYTDTLTIASNDPATPWTLVPVTLTVDSNIPPVLAEIPETMVLENQIVNVTFTATDADDSTVTVTLQNLPAFITLVGSGNGFATYKIRPPVGAQGEYYLPVVAEDNRGATDVDTFHLSVKRFAVNSFSVINITTGEVIAEFTDKITLNRARPDFAQLNIRANPSPEIVGSVKFKINGTQKNLDSSAPYLLQANYLAGIGVGQYRLLAEPFTEAWGHGQRGEGKQAILDIIYATTEVTSFSLVNTSTGQVLQNFNDSITIDAARPDFANLNIRANTLPATVGCVKFKINGTQRNIDNTNPYLLKSQLLQQLGTGSFVLFGEPFDQPNGHGQRGQNKTATLNIVNSAATTATAARQGNPSSPIEEAGAALFTIYPVPVVDPLNFSVSGKKFEGEVELTIINVQGQLVHKVRVQADALHGYTISTAELGLSSGIYYLKVQSTNGLRDTKKFTKK
jgi:subtilisin family serine protease